jgi:hypothetical protein
VYDKFIAAVKSLEKGLILTWIISEFEKGNTNIIISNIEEAAR